jgi:hypothetical protein
MESVRIVNWTLSDGRPAVATITVTREMIDDIAYADGWNINLGKKKYESMDIKATISGKCMDRTSRVPTIISEDTFSADFTRKMKAAGVYARLTSSVYIKEDVYNQVMAAIEEATREAEQDPEYAKVVAEEKRIEEAIQNEKREKEENVFRTARETGEKQVLNQWLADCNDPKEECSTDICTIWAMPDGTKITTRTHTW